jgi:hypothetical protein
MSLKVSCEKCAEQVIDLPFFELLSTSNDPHDANDAHFVCGACFGLLHASRGCAPFFECPNQDCKRVIVGHRYHSTALIATRQGVKKARAYSPGPETYIKSPTLEKDPVRFFQNQPTEEKLETMVLNIAFAETNADGSLKNQRSFSVQVPFTKSSDEYSHETRKKLINYAKLLYHVYIFPLVSSPSKLNFASMEDLDGHAFSDHCFFVETLIGIGTGKGVNNILPLGSESNV